MTRQQAQRETLALFAESLAFVVCHPGEHRVRQRLVQKSPSRKQGGLLIDCEIVTTCEPDCPRCDYDKRKAEFLRRMNDALEKQYVE